MDIDKEFESIKNIVRNLLETDEKARNNDKWLILKVLKEMGFKIYIDYKDLENMPSFETITRYRRKIQEENPNLKANEEIESIRNNRKEEFNNFFSKESRFVEVRTIIPVRRGIEVYAKQ